MTEPFKNNENCHASPMNTNFEEIFYQSPIGILFYDKEGRLTNANDSALKIARIPKLDEVLGINIFENPLIASKKEELHEKGLIKFQDSLDLIQIKEQNIYNPVKPKIVEIDWTVSVIDTGYIIQIQDITDNKKAIETIHEFDATYRGLFDSLDEAIQVCELVFDDEGHPVDNIILDVNPAYEQQTSLKRDEVIGRHIKDILPVVEQVWLERYGEVVREGKSMHFEEYNECIKRWFDVHATPLEGNNFAAVFTDITERKKAEEALDESEKNYRGLFNNKTFGLVYAQTIMGENNKPVDYRILEINDTYECLTGLKREEMINKTITEIVPGVEQSLIDKHNQVALTGKDIHFESYEPNLKHWYDVTVYSPKKGYFISIFTNITERKKLEETLKESEEKLRSVLDNTRDVIVRFNIQTGVYEFVSASVVDLIGYTPDEFLNMDLETAVKLVHPDYASFVHEAMARSKDVGKTEVEYRQGHKNGKYIWVSNHMSVLKDNSGKPLYRISSIRDITESKKAEKALKESEEKFSKSFYSNSAPMGIGSLEGKIVDVNESFSKLSGYSRDELIGKFTTEIGILTPKEREGYINNLNDGSVSEMELELTTKSGEKRDVISSTESFKIGNEIRIIFFLYDITKRKKAEESLKNSEARYRSLYENNMDAILLTKPDGSILSANPAAQKLFRMTEEEMTKIGRDGIVVKNEQLERAIKEREQTGKTNNELTSKRRDGSTFPVEVTSSIFTDSDGTVKTSMIIRDLTECKKVENELIKTIDELKRSNEELERFAYVSSHDLQEPLRMVTLYSQLLEKRYKDSLDSDADDFIEYIVDNAKRMKYLIDDLLEYSRVSSQAKESENVDLEKVLENILSNLSILIVENNVDVTHDSLPTIFADKNQMMQVLENLIGNAIKFHGKENPKIHISAQEFGGEWLFGVRDNGIGIDPNHQEQIFSIFKRLHIRKQYEGTGIGLSICKRIVEGHGGHIWVESQRGGGSTFYFTLPRNP